MTFNLQAFRRQRRSRRHLGTFIFWGGLLLLLLDITTPFPTPIMGQYVLWWLILVGIGAWVWIRAKRLPLEETIEIAKDPRYRGRLHITDLTGELGVTLETAEKILQALEKKQYALPVHEETTQAWVFPDVKSSQSEKVVIVEESEDRDA